MSYLNLDINGYEIDSDGSYCSECDDVTIHNPVSFSPLYDRWQCEKCGHIDPYLTLSDYGWQFQSYLIQLSDIGERVGIYGAYEQ